MPTKKIIPIKPISQWSFSRYNDYRKCPALAKYKFIDKIKEPGNAAMDRGSAIHKMAEDYTKGLLKKLPKELELFSEEFKALKKQKVKFVEEQWIFKNDWSLTDWNDWNGAWLRVKLDVAYINTEHNVMVIIDHKTGRYKPDNQLEYKEQLELYGLAGLVKEPSVEAVSPRLWYLDHGVIHPDPEQEEIEFTRADLPSLDKTWRARIKKMLTDTTFKPTPGAACTYCFFRKSNNGPCKF